jgi:type II secretory pathway pseudopilin PulG
MSCSSPRRVLDEKGFSLISLLLVVMILGIMMALTLESLNGTGLTSSGTGGSSTTLSIPKGAGDVVAQAQISACEADFSSVETAIVTYYSDNGKPPGAGTTWATHNPYGSPIIQSWPSGAPYFTLTWNGTVLSVTPRFGPASSDSIGTKSPRTGCYAA